MNDQQIVLLGASVRAAAWSVLSPAVCRPWCTDLFADADLQNQCSARTIASASYPRGFLAASRRAPPGSWLYTGGLENYPQLVDSIARERTLWGNSGQVLRKVRSPRLVADVLGAANIPCPATSATTPAPDGRVWLTKPYRGAGGAHITRWQRETSPPGFYYQEWIEGKSCSALFVGKRDGLARLLGATTQLVGQSWLHASGFQYCGTIGPLRLASATVAGLRRLGNALVGAFGLRGFFGVDFILQDDHPWPVEINPRYTASAEVLERGLACPLFDHHRAAFVEGYQGDITAPLPRSEIVHGKAILFAPPIDLSGHGPVVELSWQFVANRLSGVRGHSASSSQYWSGPPNYDDVRPGGQRACLPRLATGKGASPRPPPVWLIKPI